MSVQGLEVLESSPQMKTIMTPGKSECHIQSLAITALLHCQINAVPGLEV